MSLQRVRIVLCQTSHPGNIGAAARAMKTMGLGDLRLVRPKTFPDAAAQAMASGADDVLAAAQVVTRLEDALIGAELVAGCTARPRDLSHRMIDAREASGLLAAHARRAPVALLFGTEMSGLSNEELDQCQLLVRIPANPDYSSLNLAAAVQILAYELRVASVSARAPDEVPFPLARHDDLERFYRELESTLIGIGFLDPLMPKRLMTRLRRLFSRTRIEHEEFNILMGILKRIRYPRPRVGGIQDNDIVE